MLKSCRVDFQNGDQFAEWYTDSK